MKLQWLSTLHGTAKVLVEEKMGDKMKGPTPCPDWLTRNS